MNHQVVNQPRTAIVEAVKIVLERAQHDGNACPECTLGMLLDELGFQEHEFVAAGIGLSCIYATKATIDWNALMTAIEIKHSKKEENCSCSSCVIQRGEDEELLVREIMQSLHSVGISTDDIKARVENQRPHWLNECLKMES